MEGTYEIMPANPQERHIFEEIQHISGWGPTLKEYFVLAKITPEGMLLGKLNGEVVSSCLALRYSEKFGCVSVYWVKPEHRGKHYGIAIFERAMELLKDCQTVALNCASEEVINYRKWGFEVACTGKKLFVNPIPIVDSNRTSHMLTDKNQVDLNQLATFDEMCFSARRQGFLKCCMEIGQPFIAYDTIQKGYVGYAMVTPCETGFVVGPLMASSSLIVEDLIKEIFSFYSAKEKRNDINIIAYVLDENALIAQVMEKWFPREMFSLIRMYRKMPGAQLDRSCVYAISSFARG